MTEEIWSVILYRQCDFKSCDPCCETVYCNVYPSAKPYRDFHC